MGSTLPGGGVTYLLLTCYLLVLTRFLPGSLGVAHVLGRVSLA